jgi:hypothetical protein
MAGPSSRARDARRLEVARQANLDLQKAKGVTVNVKGAPNAKSAPKVLREVVEYSYQEASGFNKPGNTVIKVSVNSAYIDNGSGEFGGCYTVQIGTPLAQVFIDEEALAEGLLHLCLPSSPPAWRPDLGRSSSACCARGPTPFATVAAGRGLG